MLVAIAGERHELKAAHDNNKCASTVRVDSRQLVL